DHRYITLTLQNRADVMTLVDGVRHALGIEMLCVEFTGDRREAWLSVESETLRHWAERDFPQLHQLILQDSVVVKTIEIEGIPIATLFLEHGVQREVDVERLADFIGAANLQADTNNMLRKRN